MAIGLWVLAGLITFLLVEKIFPDAQDDEDEDEQVFKLFLTKSFKPNIKFIMNIMRFVPSRPLEKVLP